MRIAARKQGTGNPNEAYEERTTDELYNMGHRPAHPGSERKMNKRELIRTIREECS